MRPPTPVLCRLWLVVGAAALVALVGAGATVVRAEAAPALPYDPTAAPVVFLPGLTASELVCGPEAAPPLNVWPGTAATFAEPKFGLLALVNTDDGSGGIVSRTTSSDEYPLGCGEEPYRGGTAAAHEPWSSSPLWCLPEAHDVEAVPVACGSDANDEYSSLGLAIQDRIARDARGQTFVSYAWDWRRSPAEQTDGLEALLEEVTAQSGSRATVVAHSFGNILYREWSAAAEAGDGPDALVGRFVSVAGPWWGVSTAWTHPAFGQIQPGIDGALLSRFEGRSSTGAVFQSAPGTYWLFPNDAFAQQIVAEYGGAGWLAVPGSDGGGSVWVPPDRVVDAAERQLTLCPQSDVFPCQVRRLVELAQDGTPPPGFRTGGVEWVGVVGSGLATDGQICSGCLEFPDGSSDGVSGSASEPGLQPVWRIRTVNGDGNVPVFSAIQGSDPFAPPGDQVEFHFTCGIDHMDLVRKPDVLRRLVPYLLGDDPSLRDGAVFSRAPCEVPTESGPVTEPVPAPSAAVEPRFVG